MNNIIIIFIFISTRIHSYQCIQGHNVCGMGNKVYIILLYWYSIIDSVHFMSGFLAVYEVKCIIMKLIIIIIKNYFY